MDTTASDEQLIRKFVAGDRDALRTIASRHERGLLGLALGLLGGRRDLACDAVQETWLRVIRYAGSFNGHSSLKTWLYRIAVNQCHSLRPTKSPPILAASLQAAEAALSSGAVDSDELTTLRGAVEQLDADERAVVMLCYHAELTHEQAAEILEIPPGTLKSRLHRALESLRRALPAEAHR